MKIRIIIAAGAAILALAGCGAAASTGQGTAAAPAVATSASPTAESAPSITATSIPELKTQIQSLSSPQADALYLKGVRPTVTTGTDASVEAAGQGVCADIASGLDSKAIMANVEGKGFTSDQTLGIMLSAGLFYCPKK